VGVIEHLDQRGVLRGGIVAAVIGATCSVLARYVSDDKSVNALLFVILLIGLVLGGFAAGREAPQFAMINGAAAAFAAFVVVELVGVLSYVVRGQLDKLNPFGIVFLAFLSVSCGIVGGAMAAAAHTRAQLRAGDTAGDDGVDGDGDGGDAGRDADGRDADAVDGRRWSEQPGDSAP
jgi:putative membrane protein (TIGR04086 family)